MQLAATKVEAIALLHSNSATLELNIKEELGQHLYRLIGCHNAHLGITHQGATDGTCMVGLKVLHNEVVGFATGQSLIKVIKPLVTLTTIYRVHHRDTLIDNEVRVIRNTIGNNILALEEVDIQIIDTNVYNTISYILNHTFIRGFRFILQISKKTTYYQNF